MERNMGHDRLIILHGSEEVAPLSLVTFASFLAMVIHPRLEPGVRFHFG